MTVEVNSWLNYLDDFVNIILDIYWLGFTHISGGRCGSCGYPLYVVFFFLGKTSGIFFLRETGGNILGFFCLRETGSTLLVKFIE